MNKKTLIIFIIVIILILIFSCLCIGLFPFDDERDLIPDSGDSSGEIVGKYIMENVYEKYNVRLLESENREFVTLYIETNVLESGEKVSIGYNNDKLLLNTANPELENIEIKKDANINEFELKLESVKNYGIIFIKKDLSSKVNREDVKIY